MEGAFVAAAAASAAIAAGEADASDRTDHPTDLDPPSAFAAAEAAAEDTAAARAYASILPRPLVEIKDANKEASKMYGPASLSSGGVDIMSKLLENVARNGKPVGEQGFKPCFDFPDDIPVFTAEHESKLLCECHNFALPGGRLAMMARCDAQTFPIKHFESFGISAHMVYDKTDTEVDVFKDVVSELHAKTLELCEISVSTS